MSETIGNFTYVRTRWKNRGKHYFSKTGKKTYYKKTNLSTTNAVSLATKKLRIRKVRVKPGDMKYKNMIYNKEWKSQIRSFLSMVLRSVKSFIDGKNKKW